MSRATLCYQGKRYLYDEPEDQSLYAACHTYLDHVENIQLNHWYNNTDENQEYSNEYTSQLAVKSGEEVSVSVNLSAEFEGLSVGGGVDQKTFSSIETTKSKTYTLKITVPKNSDLWLYQRRYIFVTKMTWVLNAWAGLWNVGSKGAYHIQEGECVTHIDAQDYVTTKNQLVKEQSVDWPSETWEDLCANTTTRKWENTTQRCKDTLTKIGIDGSQQN